MPTALALAVGDSLVAHRTGLDRRARALVQRLPRLDHNPGLAPNRGAPRILGPHDPVVLHFVGAADLSCLSAHSSQSAEKPVQPVVAAAKAAQLVLEVAVAGLRAAELVKGAAHRLGVARAVAHNLAQAVADKPVVPLAQVVAAAVEEEQPIEAVRHSCLQSVGWHFQAR